MVQYSYLVPVIVLFGVGDHAAAIATIIFATPPMVRLTLLGLKNVPVDVVEAGVMNGCGRFQLLFRVLIPTAKRDVLIGVNQVVMQCLAMTVIASFIGAQGLGSNLMIALNSLKIGTGIEIGVCIVLIAVVLDKMSLAWAHKQKDYFADLTFFERYRVPILLAAILAAGSLLAWTGNFLFEEGRNYLYIVPHNKGITTAPFWQAAVDWTWDTFFFTLKGFNVFLITQVLFPMWDLYLGMPVVATLRPDDGYRLHPRRCPLRPDRRGLSAVHRVLGVLGQGADHGLHGVICGHRLRRHRSDGRLVVCAERRGEQGDSSCLRLPPDISVLHLPHPGDHAVRHHRHVRYHEL